jgi:hypothetical protein
VSFENFIALTPALDGPARLWLFSMLERRVSDNAWADLADRIDRERRWGR